MMELFTKKMTTQEVKNKSVRRKSEHSSFTYLSILVTYSNVLIIRPVLLNVTSLVFENSTYNSSTKIKINSTIHIVFRTISTIGRVIQLNEIELYDPPEIRTVSILGPVRIIRT